MELMMETKKDWYKDAVVYQIYPKSFCDSNGDGIGDFRGIISKLDYLKELGVNTVWISPCYPTPDKDNGYDISDFDNVDPKFGTMEDFEEMLDEMHKRGIRLLMDLVVNHTSDEHEWFKSAIQGKDAPYRDYYIWKDPVNGGPPNKWGGDAIGGSAWIYDEKSGQYYLHVGFHYQPDLDWENPKVRDEIASMINRWFDRGVDGFRCDVIPVTAPDSTSFFTSFTRSASVLTTRLPWARYGIFLPRLPLCLRHPKERSLPSRSSLSI